MQNPVIVLLENKNKTFDTQGVLTNSANSFQVSCFLGLVHCSIPGLHFMARVLQNSNILFYIGVCCIVIYIDEHTKLVLLTTTHEKVPFLIAEGYK